MTSASRPFGSLIRPFEPLLHPHHGLTVRAGVQPVLVLHDHDVRLIHDPDGLRRRHRVVIVQFGEHREVWLLGRSTDPNYPDPNPARCQSLTKRG